VWETEFNVDNNYYKNDKYSCMIVFSVINAKKNVRIYLSGRLLFFYMIHFESMKYVDDYNNCKWRTGMRVLAYSVIILVMTGGVMNAKSFNQSEVDAVKKACLDYVEGFYESSANRIKNGVHPSLVKRDAKLKSMTRDELVSIATSNKWTKPAGGITVEVYDISGNMASVRIISEYVDYAHLLKENGKWQVVNVLWDFNVK
jgi:hypothetical protein